MKTLYYSIFCLMILIGSAAEAQMKSLFPKRNKHTYEEIDTEEMIRRFVSKPAASVVSIEGIYSVSSVVTKKGKSLLSSEVKEKVVDRKDNYAKVAIIRDWADSEHEFIQISMTQTGVQKYPIVGVLTTLSEGRGFLCKHTEPNGDVLNFTFTYAGNADILEGTYTKVDGSKTITYTITLLKTFPKTETVTTQ
jgi:hypothetical protein